ncbi:MAG: FecR domain-containing protein [Pseudomonadota bacterium]
MNNCEHENDVLVEAHEWRHKFLTQDISDDEQRNFDEWYESSDANKDAYSEAMVFWDALGHSKNKLDPALLRPSKRERLIDLLMSIRPTTARRNIAITSMCMLAVFTLTLFTLIYTDKQKLTPYPTTVQSFESDIGKLHVITLDDGTIVTLGPDSAISVDYNQDSRLLELTKGVAFFEIHPDPERPFSVKVNRFNVEAIGTSFEVKRNNGVYRTSVATGNVKVSYPIFLGNSPSNHLITEHLAAGQGAKVSNQNKLIILDSVDKESIASWRDNRLIYNGDTLKEIVSELNRYSSTPIIVSNSVNSEALKVRGGFNASNIRKVLDTIAYVHNLEIDDSAKDKIVVRKKS